MFKKASILWLAVIMLLALSACSNSNSGSNSNSNTNSSSNTNSNSSTSSNTNTDTNSNSGSETVANNDSETNSESDSDSSSQTETNAETGLWDDDMLVIGMDISYPPFESYSEDGINPEGFDVDMAKAIADLLGVKVEFRDVAFSEIFDGLDKQKYDAIISAVTITEGRKELADFSTSYLENWQSIIVMQGSDPVTSMEGLDSLHVGVKDATTSDAYLAKMLEDETFFCRISGYYTVLNCFDDLRKGRLDAVLADSTVAEGFVHREPDVFEISWIQSQEPDAVAEEFGIAVRKGNTALLDSINDALQQLKENGELEKIHDNWLN